MDDGGVDCGDTLDEADQERFGKEIQIALRRAYFLALDYWRSMSEFQCDMVDPRPHWPCLIRLQS